MPFFCIHISQGSVATCLKRGGIFKHKFVANLLPIRILKKFENRIIVSEVMAKSLVSFFLTHGVEDLDLFVQLLSLRNAAKNATAICCEMLHLTRCVLLICSSVVFFYFFAFSRITNLGETGYRPGGGETICPRRRQFDSQRI